MRQVVLDTETTGLDWSQGHRIIEIGCVEILDRRDFQELLPHLYQPAGPRTLERNKFTALVPIF